MACTLPFVPLARNHSTVNYIGLGQNSILELWVATDAGVSCWNFQNAVFSAADSEMAMGFFRC